jgi:nucleotide-binding universal stress UspA family protein
MKLETVLLAVGSTDRDRTEELAETAIALAGPAGATVKLLHVFTREEYQAARDDLDIDPDSEHTPDTVAKRYATIRDLGDALEAAGVEFTWNGRLGEEDEKGEEIVEFAEEHDVDLVVVGGRRRSPSGKAVFGSTAQAVMLNAPCPVTFVRVDDGSDEE